MAKYLTLNNDGNIEEVDAAEGLDHFTENRSLAPQTVHQLLVEAADANIGIALSPKGSGAVMVQVPDGAAAGGNARGICAVDLQIGRSVNTEVASGNRSVIGGGENNSASGAYSTVGGGLNNTASAILATISGGHRGSAYLRGMEAYATERFSADGDAQRSDLMVNKQTTDATPTALSLQGATVNRMVLPTDKSWAFTIRLVAVQSAGVAGAVGDAYRATIEGLIKNVAGTTSLVGTPVFVGEMADADASWSVEVSADNTNNALAITVTGQVDKTIRWVAHIQMTEVGW